MQFADATCLIYVFRPYTSSMLVHAVCNLTLSGQLCHASLLIVSTHLIGSTASVRSACPCMDGQLHLPKQTPQLSHTANLPCLLSKGQRLSKQKACTGMHRHSVLQGCHLPTFSGAEHAPMPLRRSCRRVPTFEVEAVVFDEVWSLVAYAGYLPNRNTMVAVFRGTDNHQWSNWLENLR
eukprot:298641-Chlamydomonas_euryale.AAC.2